jgi:NitT/TauT family transport system substrate-binding protein
MFASVLKSATWAGLAFALSAVVAGKEVQAAPLKIGYSDWPGWVAWDVGIQKGMFKKAGVEVDFVWFEYVPSMEAFAAGKVDAVAMTNGDALVTGATGAPNVMILLNDFSNGNDMVVGAPAIKTMKDLKGKKVGVEVGFVSHLLLLKGLEKAGLKEGDVTLVNVPTHQTPQTLASGDVSAISAWQPNSGEALKALAGAHPLFTSADAQGLIYDALCVNPVHLAKNRKEWEKVVAVWYEIVDFILDPKTQDEAVKIMAARVGLKPEEYKPFLAGTKLLTAAESKKAMEKGDGFSSLYGSSAIVDAFNVSNKVYEKPQKVEAYIDASLVKKLK